MKPVAPETISKEATFQQKLLFEEQMKTYRANFEKWQNNLGDLAKVCQNKLFYKIKSNQLNL
jgi:hypothetical protein